MLKCPKCKNENIGGVITSHGNEIWCDKCGWKRYIPTPQQKQEAQLTRKKLMKGQAITERELSIFRKVYNVI